MFLEGDSARSTWKHLEQNHPFCECMSQVATTGDAVISKNPSILELYFYMNNNSIYLCK
jgi:hypothetical protein